ncbi:hypothetical protein [Mesorhizobium sp. M0013]|uniref:hypothetical protein n=1 Tax=Mesorhizobium sp. M0013 TaxID=2956841 RepID=UPI00333DFEE5
MKKPTHTPTYREALDGLLKAIDGAPTAPDHPIFKKWDDKEYFETLLMFSFRKQQAAEHHIGNVESMLETAEAAAIAAMKNKGKQAKNAVASSASLIVNSGPSTAYIHELSAFLAAVRSGLDFLAVAAARTTPGILAHSIHTLEKMVDKGQQGGILEVVKTHHAWLAELRDYRDEVVHRQVVQAPAEGWLVSTKGKTSKAIIPIVVPRRTPKRAFDTRRSRMMDNDVPLGLDRMESHGQVTFPDGTKKTIEHKVTFRPSASHVPIVELMTHHLLEYRKFSAEMFAVITKSGFGTVK